MKLTIWKSLLIFSTISFLFVFLLVLATNEENVLIVGDVTAMPSDVNISIPIYLNNNNSVAGLQYELSYVTFLTYKGYELTSRTQNTTIVINDGISGLLKIAALSLEEIDAGEGSILNLIFDVDSSATSGDYLINVSNLIIGDINAQSLNSSNIDGVLTIIVDTDEDGILDPDDACPTVYGCSAYDGCSFGLKSWLPPIINQEEFDLQEGATLPFKFNVTNCSDYFYEDSGVKVRVYNESLGIDKEYNASGTDDDFIRINSTEKLYITNIHTNELEMPLGDYDITTTFSNNLIKTIVFELVEKGEQGKGKGKGSK